MLRMTNSKMKQHNYFTYILTTASKKVLYVGVTNDIERRLVEHYWGNNLKSNFTTKYKCYYLIYFERYQYIDDALDREKQLKRWRRSKKEDLIAAMNPGWEFLNDRVNED